MRQELLENIELLQKALEGVMDANDALTEVTFLDSSCRSVWKKELMEIKESLNVLIDSYEVMAKHILK